MAEKIEARVTHRFNHTAEAVFDAWTDPGLVRHWLGRSVGARATGEIERVELDARVGGAFFFSDRRPDGLAEHWGTYMAVDRPTRLQFTWITSEHEEADPSVVTLTLVPEDEGAVATLVHSMDARWRDFVAQTEASWAGMLDEVEHLLNQNA